MNRALFPIMQRAWSLVAAGLRDETTIDAQAHAREEPSIVAALCTCVLGEREGMESAAWPPRSVAELRGRTERDAGVLEQGFDALDELALRETGWRFARLDRRAQLRSLFELEAGRGRLSRRHASVFMDAFLTLAAQACLRDALQMAPAAGRLMSHR
ncbi:hypothetical protein [Piscinibacter sp. XHJ-5]|uniref:hypothetical protein n=1 Tax=Piscinibacter sp. XHJ-5 TaxID=3037797 RepID=UPI00245311D7|nr:hypothetical protein [Piscinibacter sp. XHJ-5]